MWALTLFRSPLSAASYSPLMVNYSDSYNVIENISSCTYTLYTSAIILTHIGNNSQKFKYIASVDK